jgi:hypothetical protein
MSESWDLSGTSPAAASTVAGVAVSSLTRCSELMVEAQLVGATGGTLDVWLQRKVGPNLWVDWVHFAQLAAGASAIHYAVIVKNTASASGAIAATTTVGNDATPAVGAGTGLISNNHPGDAVRVVFVAGASTSAGAAQKITIWGVGASRS